MIWGSVWGEEEEARGGMREKERQGCWRSIRSDEILVGDCIAFYELVINTKVLKYSSLPTPTHPPTYTHN